MKLEFAELLVDYNSDLELRDDYSGRGMCGNSTAGVVGSMNDVLQAIGDAIEYGDEDELQIIQEGCQAGVRTDSMGLSMIIY